MRTLCTAVILLVSTQIVAASERLAFWRHVERLGSDISLPAYLYLQCSEAAARNAAHRDPLSPASWMTEWAATEAAKQCEPEGAALVAAAGKVQANAIKAIVHRANVETARAVRRGEPLALCAVGWRGPCFVK